MMPRKKKREVKGPLDGIKVIECAQWFVGPYAGFMLADLGADVIKVEEPVGGDRIRGLTYLASQKIEHNWMFEHANRNKRSITLDLGTQKGREIIYKLIEQADVFLHNFTLGVPEKLGVDYDTLYSYNPRLIYAQGSGWGPEGPLRAQNAFDPAMQSRSGLVMLQTNPGEIPTQLASAIGDITTALILVPAILAALLAREHLGIGQKVDVSGLGSLMYLQMNALAQVLIGGQDPVNPMYRPNVRNPLWCNYQCTDGKWITLGMIASDQYWPAFCKAVGIEHLEKDPKFENSDMRRQNAQELISILDKVFATRPLSEWLEHFEHQGGLIYAPIQSIQELATDPQVIANEYITDFNHPVHGMIKVLGFPYKFSRTPASLRKAAPEHGQHTEEVLLEMGYSWDDIAQLRDEGVI